MDIRLAGHVLPNPLDPTQPAFGSSDPSYPAYHFRFGKLSGTGDRYELVIPTQDPNPAEVGPIQLPEQADWIRALVAACGMSWSEEGWPGIFYTNSTAECFALIDAMLARGLQFSAPSTAEHLAEWRTQLGVR